MENLYGFSQEQPATAPPPPPPRPPQPLAPSSSDNAISSMGMMSSGGFSRSDAANHAQVSQVLRAKVASHPLFPQLLHAYIDCHKVGATPEMAQLLAEIGEENNNNNNNNSDVGVCQISSSFFGADPELDNFMETYCNLLAKYKSDLSMPFDEATEFLNDMKAQLNSMICDGGGGGGPTASNDISPPELLVTAGSSEKGFNSKYEEDTIDQCKRINEDQELKDNLLRRYSGYISSLKHEFSKNKKKERLPKEAKQILLAWWNIHFKWPYPTDADKVTLVKLTGLDQKQINNWFINQRKRHWKPSEEMQAAVLDGIYGPIFMSESD